MKTLTFEGITFTATADIFHVDDDDKSFTGSDIQITVNAGDTTASFLFQSYEDDYYNRSGVELYQSSGGYEEIEKFLTANGIDIEYDEDQQFAALIHSELDCDQIHSDYVDSLSGQE